MAEDIHIPGSYVTIARGNDKSNYQFSVSVCDLDGSISRIPGEILDLNGLESALKDVKAAGKRPDARTDLGLVFLFDQDADSENRLSDLEVGEAIQALRSRGFKFPDIYSDCVTAFLNTKK